MRVTFTDAALDDLRRLGPDVAPKVLRKIVTLRADPEVGIPLAGQTAGFRRLTVGWKQQRVVYRLTGDGTLEICAIWSIGTRSDSEIYAEATARVATAPGDDPALRRLADVIGVLGRGVARVDAVWPAESPGEPVPDWLADRLVHKAGVAAEKVAALNLQQAVDLWTQFAEPLQPAYEWGSAVGDMRERRGWTQAQLADAAAMTESAVARFEAGDTPPTVPLLGRLADALEADVVVWLSPRA
ncbi:hypothetical protein GCM10029964_007170 [Kibdelosporangium lantanae]